MVKDITVELAGAGSLFADNVIVPNTNGGRLHISGGSNNVVSGNRGLIEISHAGGTDNVAQWNHGTTATPAVTLTGGSGFRSTGWIAFTPTWTGATTNPTLGNGTLTARYRVAGDTIEIAMYLAFGSTTTAGTGAWSFTFPTGLAPTAVPAGDWREAFQLTHRGWSYDNSAAARYNNAPFISTTTTWQFRSVNRAATWPITAPTVPFTWAVSDKLAVLWAYNRA